MCLNKICFKLGKTATETSEMFTIAYGEIQIVLRFSIDLNDLGMVGNRLTMMRNHQIQQAPHQKASSSPRKYSCRYSRETIHHVCDEDEIRYYGTCQRILTKICRCTELRQNLFQDG